MICVKARPTDSYHNKSMTKDSIDFIIHDNATIKIKGNKPKRPRFRATKLCVKDVT